MRATMWGGGGEGRSPTLSERLHLAEGAADSLLLGDICGLA